MTWDVQNHSGINYTINWCRILSINSIVIKAAMCDFVTPFWMLMDVVKHAGPQRN